MPPAIVSAMGVLDDGERVVAADAAAWRDWLQANHGTSRGVWLVRPRGGNDEPMVGYEDSIRQALCFGWVDGPVRTFDALTGGIWYSPRRPSSGWAATNKARLIELEAAGLVAEAGRRAVQVARSNGAWTVLDRAQALVEPPDLAAALDAEPAARAAWDTFPPSVRKVGITAVDTARRPQTRASRIASVVERAARGQRP